MLDADFFAIRIVQKLRTARANVIASLTEFVEERIAPFVRVAILEEEPKIRSGAVKIIFSMIDSELKLMDERLSSGAFRLVLSSMHRGVCDAIEQLVLHRPMEEGSLESHENWKGLPKLTETQRRHSSWTYFWVPSHLQGAMSFPSSAPEKQMRHWSPSSGWAAVAAVWLRVAGRLRLNVSRVSRASSWRRIVSRASSLWRRSSRANCWLTCSIHSRTACGVAARLAPSGIASPTGMVYVQLCSQPKSFSLGCSLKL